MELTSRVLLLNSKSGVIRTLLAYGADLEGKQKPAGAEGKQKPAAALLSEQSHCSGGVALHKACLIGSVEACRELLAHGAHVHARCNLNPKP